MSGRTISGSYSFKIAFDRVVKKFIGAVSLCINETFNQSELAFTATRSGISFHI